MNEKEFVEKSITLGFEFERYLIAHPEIAERIPKGAKILFILEDDYEYTQREMQMAKVSKEEGCPVIVVKIEKIVPPFESRLINPRIEFTPSL